MASNICRCNVCVCLEFKDADGVMQRGQRADPRTIKAHARRGNLRQARGKDMSEVPASTGIPGASARKPATRSPHPPPSGSSTPRHQDAPQRVSDPRTDREGVAKLFEQLSVTDINVQDRLRLISQIHSATDLQAATVPYDIRLAFVSPPLTALDPPSPLDVSDKRTANYVSFGNWARHQLRMVEELPPVGDKDADGRRDGLIRVIRGHINRLPQILSRSWELEIARLGLLAFDDEDAVPETVPSPPILALQTRTSSTPPFILCILLVVSLLHSVAAISRPFIALVLALVKVVLFGAFSLGSTSARTAASDAMLSNLLKAVPKDVRTALSTLGAEPDFVRYACCKTCFAIYPPNSSSPIDPYPHACTFQETDKPICGAPLVRQVQRAGKPNWTAIKTYPYRTFKSWLAEFLLRPGIEEYVEAAWHEPPEENKDDPRWKDIMHSPAIRSFIGPDGKTPFSVSQDGEVRLVFSLFIDWFNPLGNKQAGKSRTVGGIYMACLNLPPHLRYRSENLYLVAIIPGPREPQVDQLNRLLRPLVDELIQLWHVGIFLDRTADRASGRSVRAAAIPLVCDLPALRKAAGFAHHSSRHFCSFCPLPSDEIGNVDRATWPRQRTWAEHIRLASEWRDASTEAERNAHFSQHGLRWSELLRLDYWDPTVFALVDSMHNLFLGELKHHCMHIFGIDTAGERSTNKNTVAHTPSQQQAQLDRMYQAIVDGSASTLMKARRDYLAALAEYNDVVTPHAKPTKAQLTDAILKWFSLIGRDATRIRLPPTMEDNAARFSLPLVDGDAQSRSQKYRSVFTGDVLEEVRNDITNTFLPTWLEPPPRNLGSPSHGKLKADHWRTIGTVSLVITLIRLWGTAGASAEEKAVLDNFIALAIAVDLATRRSMSPSRADMFDQYIQKYVRGLRTLFDHSLVPNHHLSLHLKRCLELFGPVHGWWAFPFERVNGLLQRFNTNSKTEDIPLTFMRYFYMGATLRWLMHAIKWPVLKVFSDLISAFDTAFGDVLRGTRVLDTQNSSANAELPFAYDSSKEVGLTISVYDALLKLVNATSMRFQSSRSRTDNGLPRLPPDAQVVPRISHRGVTFASQDSSKRNSFVLFNYASTPDQPRRTSAGQIFQIFFHRRLENTKEVVECFLVIKEYTSLKKDHEKLDPYLKFDALDARLYYSSFRPAPQLVRLEDVVSHFAALTYVPGDIGRECIVVRSLDRS